MLIILSGPSGVGKNTIIQKLIERNPKIKYLMSCTTRKQRDVEKVSNYIHLTEEEMKKKIENNELFEYEHVHFYVYGTLKSSIDEVKKDENIYIKDLGVLGQEFFASELKGKAKILSVFLDCEDDELINRLKQRGEQEIQKRSERFEFEREHKNNFDVVIDNVDIDKTIKIIEEKIKKAMK